MGVGGGVVGKGDDWPLFTWQERTLATVSYTLNARSCECVTIFEELGGMECLWYMAT